MVRSIYIMTASSASSISSLLYSPTALTAKDSSRALTGSDPTSHCSDIKHSLFHLDDYIVIESISNQ